MANCPYTKKECPQHNKKGGCEFWMSYTGNKNTIESKVEGCAIVITPLLLIEQANAMGLMCGEIEKVGAEVSSSRAENIVNNDALRKQILAVSMGTNLLIEPNFNNKIEEKK